MSRYVVCLFVSVLILGIPLLGYAQEKAKPIQTVISYSSKVYEFIDDGKPKVADNYLNQLDQELKKHPLRLDDLDQRVFTTSEDHLKQLIVTNTDSQALRGVAIQFRLVVDALDNDSSPLWKRVGTSLFTAFDKVQSDVKKKDDSTFQHDLNNFMGMYQMIYPALVITMSPSQLSPIDEQISALSDARTTLIQDDHNASLSYIEQLKMGLHQLFQNNLISHPTKSIMKLIFLISSIVLVTLVYVFWRKYKGVDWKSDQTFREN